MSENKIQVKIEADASEFSGALKDAVASLAASIREMKNGFGELSEGIKASMQESANSSSQAAQQMASALKNSAAETKEAMANLSSAVQKVNTEAANTSPVQGFSATLKEAMQSAIALTASVVSLQSALSLLKQGISYNAQMEQAAISFETMLKSADKAKAMLADLQKMAAATPFEFPDLQDGAKRMLAFGFAAKSVIPTLTAVGDAASGLGMSGAEGINRILLALGQMRAKGKVSADEMLQMTEAGIPAWDILAKSIGKSTAEVMKLAEQGAIPAEQAIQALVAGMEERFPNMMQKQSKSFNGMMSTIRDNFRAVIGDIVKPGFEELTNEVLPGVVRGLEHFAKTMKESGAAAAFKEILPAALVDVTLAASKAIGGGLSFMRQHASMLGAAMTGLVIGIGTYKGIALASTIVTAAQTLAYSLQTGAVALTTRGTAAFTLANIAATASAVMATIATEGLAAGFTALAVAMNINPVILAVTAAMAVLAGCVYLVYENWDEFKAWCIEFWNDIVDFIADNIGLLAAMFPRLALAIFLVSEYWDEAVKFLSELWEGFVNFFKKVCEVIGHIVSDICEAMGKFAAGGAEGVGKFMDSLGDLANRFLPDWAKSMWDQIVGLGDKLADKTAEIGERIRNNLKIKDGGKKSVGDFKRGEYEDSDDEGAPKKPQLPTFEPIDWSGIGGAGAKAAKGSTKKEQSEYEKAKKLYAQQMKLAEYTAAEKEALYKKYLENIQKSDQEAMDYRVGLYQIEKAAFAESLKMQETELKNSRTRGLVSEQAYNAELAALKRKNLDAETEYRVKAMMEAESLTNEEKEAQKAAYKEKVQAAAWYKSALGDVLNAEKTLADFQKNMAKSVNDLRKQQALAAIAAEEERLNTLYERNQINQDSLIAALKEFELQRYTLEKDSLEDSLEACAVNAEKMKAAYLDYTSARDQATRDMVANEMIANGKSADEVIRVLKQLDQLKTQYAKKEDELEKKLKNEKLQRVKEIQNAMKDSISQNFQDVLTGSKTFLQALKNMWSTTMKAILKQFADTVAQTITNKGFQKQVEKITGKQPEKNATNKARVAAEKATQAQLTAVNAQGNAQRLAQDQSTGQQQIATTETKAQTQEAVERAKDTSITASAQAAGKAAVQSIESAITAMIQMLPMLILMSVLTGLFGGGGKEKTTETTGDGINLGRNPESYYTTPTLTGIPSFDVGSWSLPSDTLAMVHKDEMIVPAKNGMADGMRNMLSGGGQSSSPTMINLSYSAAHYGRTNRDVRDEIKQNAKFLVKTLHSEYRNFNRGGQK